MDAKIHILVWGISSDNVFAGGSYLNSKFPRAAAGVTYAGNARCTGSEKHLAQCLLDYGMYHPHQGNMPQCDESEVVNLQCWPGVEQYR